MTERPAADRAQLADMVVELEDTIDALLRANVRGNDESGYAIIGVWTRAQPYPTRAEANANYIAFAKRRRAWPNQD